jgi:hypothetical protein
MQLLGETNISAVLNKLSAVDRISAVDRDWSKRMLHLVHATSTKDIIEMNLGVGSTAADLFNNRFRDIAVDVQRARLDQIFDIDALQQPITDAVSGSKGIVTRLSKKFLNSRQPQVQQLLHLLAPMHDWQDKGAPLEEWLKRACYRLLPVDQVAELVDDLQKHVQEVCRQIMHQLLIRFIADVTSGYSNQVSCATYLHMHAGKNSSSAAWQELNTSAAVFSFPGSVALSWALTKQYR